MTPELNYGKFMLTGDANQDIRILADELSRLRGRIAFLKRGLDDMLYNLDEDNLGVVLKQEKKDAWIKINATEEGLATEVGKRQEGDRTLQSNIEQTAGEINTRVMATYESTVTGNGAPTSRTDKNKLYYDQTNNKYYYYSPITEQWKITDSRSIYSAFKQTPAGFEFTNDVKVNGDLITSGTITSTNIDGVNITGAHITGGDIAIDTDMSIGKKLTLNADNFLAAIEFLSKQGAQIAQIDIDPISKSLILHSFNGNISLLGKKIYANDKEVATQEWVQNQGYLESDGGYSGEVKVNVDTASEKTLHFENGILKYIW